MQYGAMIEWAERAAELAARLGDPAVRAEAVAAAARGYAVAGHMGQAARWCDEAAELINGLPDRVLAERLAAITMLATAELFLHRFADAYNHCERAMAIGRATGQGQQFPQLFAFLGISTYLQGQLQCAVDPLDAAVEAARLTGHAQMLSWSLYARSLLAFAVGDTELALGAAQESLDVIDDGKPNHSAAYSALALAEANLAIGKSGGIAELLERTSGGSDMPLAAPSWRASFLKRMARPGSWMETSRVPLALHRRPRTAPPRWASRSARPRLTALPPPSRLTQVTLFVRPSWRWEQPS